MASEQPLSSRTSQPLLSACLIVRDEAGNLPRCLSALAGVVDEVVVHDTGSQDDSVALARAAGAHVIEGSWHDDFARARNVARDACTGRWILHVDADEEVVVPDPTRLRDELHDAERAGVDALVVTIGNVADDGAVGTRHRSIRLFRTPRARWAGAVHEQVVPTGGPPLQVRPTSSLEIVHHGYLRAAADGRDKAARNLALAEAALADVRDGEEARALLDLARSLAANGRHEEALARCAEARDRARSTAITAWVLRFGAETCLVLARPADALDWVAELRRRGLGSEVADLLEGTALLLLGRGDEALVLLDGLGEAWDATGINVPDHLVRQRRGLARLAAGDPAAAAAELLSVVEERPATPVWGQLAAAALRSDGPVTSERVASAVSHDHVRSVLAQLLLSTPDAAEAVAQALWDRLGPDPRLLGFAAHHATRLDVGGALDWSVRLRAAGMTHHCPLRRRAARADLPVLERVLAGAVAHGTFADPDAETAVLATADQIPDDDLIGALALLGELSPSLVPRFVLAAASDRARAGAVADALDALGATEQADLLRSV